MAEPCLDERITDTKNLVCAVAVTQVPNKTPRLGRLTRVETHDGRGLKARGQSFLAMITAPTITVLNTGNQLGAAKEMFRFVEFQRVAPSAQGRKGGIRKT